MLDENEKLFRKHEISEDELYESFDKWLDELVPITEVHYVYAYMCKKLGLQGNPFSILLKEGDPIAYNELFQEFCDMYNYEIIE